MTYKEIVDKIASICVNHDIIREFGYGAISDLKTLNKEANANITDDSLYAESQTLYPYVFLNPTQSTRTSQMISYRFNMIVMDTVLPNGLELLTNNPGDIDQKDPPYEQTLQVQSDCAQYVDDIIARLRFGDAITDNYDPSIDVQLSVNLTPFKERFADTVAGMTATLEIQVTKPINECIAPY
jgi:hypothetical protein